MHAKYLLRCSETGLRGGLCACRCMMVARCSVGHKSDP